MMQSEDHEAQLARQRPELLLEPRSLGATVGEWCVAVEREEADAFAEIDAVPAMSALLRERLPPELETTGLGAIRELVIAEHRQDAKSHCLPESSLIAVYGVVVG